MAERAHMRVVVALLSCALLSTACGARFDADQERLLLGQTAGGSTTVTQLEGDTSASTGEPALSAEGAPAASDTGAAAPGDGQAVTSGGAGSPGGDTAAGAAGAPSADGSDGGGEAAEPGPEAAAPAGGNGGATDKGVTKDKIVLSNISDVGGAVPGLFEDGQLATKAYVSYFNATKGSIFGRKLAFLPLDSRLDAGATRSAAIKACADSFASVGSTSALDSGGAPVMQECGLPDLRTLAATTQMKKVPTSFPLLPPGGATDVSLGGYGWTAEQFPQAVKSSAMLYVAAENVAQVVKPTQNATKRLGYTWKYTQAVDVQETNYSPFVLKMKSEEIKYVTLIGNYQAAVKLAQAMQQQGFKPEVFASTIDGYNENYLSSAGSAVEGSYIAVSTALVEEQGSNPELALYAQWLNQVAPGSKPSFYGLLAWSAGRLFTETATKVGPKLTREAFNAEVRKATAFTGGGLLPKSNVGGKQAGDCTVWVQVKNGKFVRVEPAGKGFRCGDGVVKG